jgi:hypothetical protein
MRNKKSHGAYPAHPWLCSIAPGSEAWVNPPKAKKEIEFVKSGHHCLFYNFYYFYRNVMRKLKRKKAFNGPLKTELPFENCFFNQFCDLS